MMGSGDDNGAGASGSPVSFVNQTRESDNQTGIFCLFWVKAEDSKTESSSFEVRLAQKQ